MKPFMRVKTVDVFQLKDISSIPSMVRLTKWLPPIKDEFEYLSGEYHRISSDERRTCYIVYHAGKIALYVNDITSGAFERLKEEDDSEIESD